MLECCLIPLVASPIPVMHHVRVRSPQLRHRPLSSLSLSRHPLIGNSSHLPLSPLSSVTVDISQWQVARDDQRSALLASKSFSSSYFPLRCYQIQATLMSRYTTIPRTEGPPSSLRRFPYMSFHHLLKHMSL